MFVRREQYRGGFTFGDTAKKIVRVNVDALAVDSRSNHDSQGDDGDVVPLNHGGIHELRGTIGYDTYFAQQIFPCSNFRFSVCSLCAQNIVIVWLPTPYHVEFLIGIILSQR